MSERGHFRGGGGGGRGGGGRGGGGRGGNRGGAHGQGGGASGAQTEKPKKENILNLNKYINKEVNVKFNGGRESMFSPGTLPCFHFSPCLTLSSVDTLR